MLQCKTLRYSYQENPHFDFDFDFSVQKQQFAVILGQSGSGKSTLLSLIAGFLKPSEGTLMINGKAIQKEPPSERDLSILFQSHNLFPHLTAFENAALGLSPKLKISKDESEEVLMLFEELAIADILHKEASLLSGGQMQRVAIARCLLRKKPLLLLDEPFCSLDPSLREKGHELLYKIAKTKKLTVLFITHFPDEVKSFADIFFEVKHGRIYF